MPPIRVLSGKQTRRILEDNGFVFVSQRGSHVKLRKQIEGMEGGETVTLTVIVPDHKELRPGTLGSVISQSGLPRELFEA